MEILSAERPRRLARMFSLGGYASLFILLTYLPGLILIDVPQDIFGVSAQSRLFLCWLLGLMICSFYLALKPPTFKSRQAYLIVRVVYYCVLCATLVLLVDPATCLDSYSIECTAAS